MFKFLKDKLKSAISRISEGVEKEGKIGETIVEKHVEEQKEEKGFFAKLKEKIVGREEKPIDEKKEEIKEVIQEKPQIHEEKTEIREKPEAVGQAKVHAKPEAKTEIKEEKKERFEHEKGEKQKAEAKKLKEEIRHEPKHHEHAEHKIGIKEQTRHEIKAEEKPIEKEPEKKGFFQAIKEKITTTTINESQFEKLFWELEMALMESNVAVEVIGKIKNDLKNELVEKPIKRTRVEDTIVLTLKSSIESLFENNSLNLITEIKNKKEKPYIIAFFGINGSGKTTSIAKLASMLKSNKLSCVLAASDTFRAASIEQLQQHADKLDIKMIKHDYGSDPAAVAFDAIKHARAKNIDVVLIDTAGRMHSNQNLIDEMKKIIRVAKPDLKIFVGESITGNDCVEQAKTFNDAVGIDGIILAKADIDEKGGAAVSVSYVTKKPILFLGTGQSYSDLEPFDKEKIMKNIGLA